MSNVLRAQVMGAYKLSTLYNVTISNKPFGQSFKKVGDGILKQIILNN